MPVSGLNVTYKHSRYSANLHCSALLLLYDLKRLAGIVGCIVQLYQ